MNEIIANEKSTTSKVLSIISTVLCLIGGALFLLFGIYITIRDVAINGGYGPILIVLAVFVVTAAFIRLKYTRRGSIFCLALGIIGLFIAWALEMLTIFGTVFTLIGSIIGFIGVMKE
ncbi:MAG: hypothetical protein ACXAEX_19240 [Promethearchaeota archaeon]|jgi:uncharacterized protein with PQ loop repeat